MSENDLTGLFDAALAAQRAAYAPYSGYQVGAALRTASGRIFAGCNVENASFPTGICAEAGAISAMVAAGERAIAEMLVLGDGEVLTTPCGACRQRIREFAAPETPIHVADRNGIRASFTQSSLLPHSFGPDNLAASRRD
ncbi:MAG: cytidine deaminase [Methylobacteriaceae bacterium]|nr:cytidine deaminase [Methylobacteriaceae bacterium]